MSYNPREIEKKWQKRWEESDAFTTNLDNAKRPYFTHTMFPYPSGDRLHMGHVYNFSIAHSYARFKRLQGYDVYEPFGFDSFGLPAENYAIKTGIHPAKSTASNITTMIEQLKAMGNVYDWGSNVSSHEPSYYRWTQWVFLELFKKDLIYKKAAEVNWDPVDQTVLANEQVLPDGTAERSGAVVEKRKMPQWFARVTKYADELLEEGEKLDWPNKTKVMQRNWIGKSIGCNVKWRVAGEDITLETFTTTVDTIYGVTFAVISPEHPELKNITKPEHASEIDAYIKQAVKKNSIDRMAEGKKKTGIDTGAVLVHPFTGEKIPLWVADYVLMDYGTGVVMGVPAHDQRDMDFAHQYGFEIKQSIEDKDGKTLVYDDVDKYTIEGKIIDSEDFTGMNIQEGREAIINKLEHDDAGNAKIQYKLRDWCLSRQRYWGAPIPIVYDPEGNAHPIPEKHLPWMLPADVEFKPTGTSPLAESQELRERTEKIFGKGWTPEVDTMDTFVCSSFYTYRFLAYNDKENFVSRDREDNWMPVDFYCGGSEHACMHLIYARFVTKALADLGHVKHREPYQRLFHQGMITRNGSKISKRGNPLSPDDWIEKYGSDVLRMYLMFMGPFDQGGDWSDRGISGPERFTKRIYEMISERYDASFEDDDMEVLTALHKSIKKVGEDIEKLHFNTALASLMETLNVVNKREKISKSVAKTFIILLSPMAPHLAEELWEKIHIDRSQSAGFVIEQSWPKFDQMYLQESTVTIAIQINGKLRGTYQFANGVTKEEVIETVYDEENIKKWMEGKSIVKEIFIPNKILNVVVK